MKTWNFSDNTPGERVPYGQRSYYKPEPLPPTRELEIDQELSGTISDASFWLGKLSGRSEMVDYPPLLYTSLVRKEAIESAEIEGADVDMDDVYRFETQRRDNESDPDRIKSVQEVLNYEDAITRGIDVLDTDEPITADLVKSLHETLMRGVRSNTEVIGEYRDTPVHLGSFVPPSPGSVPGHVDALLSYVRSGGAYHPLIDIALVHYQFETIHPFGDGNGRLGRVLVTLQLYDEGYLDRPNLYLSEYFNRNKETYVERMRAVSRDGAWEAWLQFFLTGLEQQARESYERTLELHDLQERYEETYGDSKRTDAQLAMRLFERPYLTANNVEEMLDVSGPTAYRAIHSLEDDGVLEEVTGKESHREYRASEIFEILERPPTTYD